MKYLKTEAGQKALKDRVPPLSARQRSLLIMCDGQRTQSQLVEVAQGLGGDAGDLEQLVALGLIEPVAAPEPTAGRAVASARAGAAPASAPATAPGSASRLSPEAAARRYQAAYPIATRLTASLGLRGFRLNLAVERASGYDELAALLPQLTEALGAERVEALRRALFEG